MLAERVVEQPIHTGGFVSGLAPTASSAVALACSLGTHRKAMEKSTAVKLCGASFVTGMIAGWYLNKLARKVMLNMDYACSMPLPSQQ